MAGENTGILPVYKFAIYEIPLLTTSSGNQYNFPVNNYLVGRKVYAIEVYGINDIAKSPISTGNATWTAAMMADASLTIHCFDPNKPGDAGAKADWIKQLPVNALHRSFNSSATSRESSVFQQMILAGLVIDWNNSHIDFVATQVFAANTSALFGVYYL